MGLKSLGYVVAHCPSEGNNRQYVRVGSFFEDDRGNTVVKLDALPLSNSTWNGWLNFFRYEDKDKEEF